MLPVVEIFGPTIQGEGARAGNISYFIRFGGCNFKCKGFGVKYLDPDGNEKIGCDSYYSVDQKFKKKWELLSYKEIIEKIDQLIVNAKHQSIKPDIVITGGEPTLYWKHNDFQNLLIYYISRGHNITIETNASLDIEFTKPYQKDIIFSMSVKLSNSEEPEHKRINIENISNILENSPNSYFKFVIDAENKDKIKQEIEAILKEVPWYADIYLMPMGETTDVINKNSLECAKLAIEKGWKYSDRLHIRIWENKQGV